MTPGIPGTGIGGLFYMFSAAALPLREAVRRLRGDVGASRWRDIALQQVLAAGILGGMWTTGWLLGVLFDTARRPVLGAAAATVSHNMWRTTTFEISLTTLAVILCTVELVGFWHRRRGRRDATRVRATLPTPIHGARRRVVAGSSTRLLLLLLAVELASAADPPTAVTQTSALAARSLARADSTYATGDAPAATRAYAAVLAIDPENSRATYRLGDLQRHEPARALPLFEQYVKLEPSDLWGYLAVADMLSRLGRNGAALHWSAAALRLAPGERDAVIGRARVLARARHTDQAVATYRGWLATHPRDAEAWQELARELLRAGRPGEAVDALERAQAIKPDPRIAERLTNARGIAAPAFTPQAAGSHDSDGNTIWRLGGALELGASGPARFGVDGGYVHVGDGASAVTLEALALRTTWRPLAVARIDASGGGTRVEPIASITGSSATLIPTGQVRVRWRAPASRLGVDLSADRSLVDASPLLVTNRVVRTQYGGSLSLPLVGPFTLRGIGKMATLRDSFEVNHKSTLTGVMAVAVSPTVELSAQVHQIHYDHPSVSGYFAPWQVQVAEAGMYAELETSGALVFAIDAGAGVQRVALQRPRFGSWTPALRLYAMLDAPLAPGRDLRLELESEDSQVAPVAATSGQWRYGSVVASLRWALP